MNNDDNMLNVRDDLDKKVVAKLIEGDTSISIAESCTGGLLSAMLVNVPGVSAVFMEGIVTYSNEAKVRRLGVKEETLVEFGAVSSQTAVEMAVGMAKAAKTEVAISVTGIAGDEGVSLVKPAGLAYVGLFINDKVDVKKIVSQGGRQRIRKFTAEAALEWLLDELEKSE